MKSIYISGPYTAPDRKGEDKNIRAAARVAAGYLRDGWAIFCPHTMTTLIDREFNSDRAIGYQGYLTLDLYWLAKCDAIHMLPGWHVSRGAWVEYMVAQALGLEILGDVDVEDGERDGAEERDELEGDKPGVINEVGMAASPGVPEGWVSYKPAPEPKEPKEKPEPAKSCDTCKHFDKKGIGCIKFRLFGTIGRCREDGYKHWEAR